MKAKRVFVFITVSFVVLLLLWTIPHGHDIWYHLYRIGAMGVEIKKAPWCLPIRILSDTYSEYGYGAALYYGDVFLYLPAMLVALGMDIVWAYKLFSAMMWLGCFGITYYAGKIMGASKENCALYAYMYSFSTSFLLNLCVRCAVGETLAMIFLPLVFCSFYCLLYKKTGEGNKYWILLAFSMAAIALSHMISLLWCGILLCIWTLLEWKVVLREKKWFEVVKAAIFMIGLSASFLFPMFEQMLYQKVQTAGNNAYEKSEFMAYGIEWMDFFISYDTKKMLVSWLGLDWNVDNWHPGTIGLFAILLIACIWIYKIRLSKKAKVVFVTSLVGLVLLGVSPVMNVAKEFMAFMQFSWRILPFLTVGLTIVAWKASEKNRKIEWTLYVGTFVIALMLIIPRYGYQFFKGGNPGFQYNPNAADALYLPEKVSRDTYKNRGEVVIADKELVDFNWERREGEIWVEICHNPYENVSLEFPLYIYKGYVGVQENGEFLIPKRSEKGLVCLDIGNYEGEIRIKYEGTLCQKISDLITVLTLLGFVIISWRKRRKVVS